MTLKDYRAKSTQLCLVQKRFNRIEIDLWQSRNKYVSDAEVLLGVAQTLDGLNLSKKRVDPDDEDFFVIHTIESKSKRYKLSFSIVEASLKVHELLEYGIDKKQYFHRRVD